MGFEQNSQCSIYLTSYLLTASNRTSSQNYRHIRQLKMKLSAHSLAASSHLGGVRAWASCLFLHLHLDDRSFSHLVASCGIVASCRTVQNLSFGELVTTSLLQHVATVRRTVNCSKDKAGSELSSPGPEPLPILLRSRPWQCASDANPTISINFQHVPTSMMTTTCKDQHKIS